MKTIVLLSFFAIVIGLPRVLGHHGEAYQAIAHCFVGGLFGAWLADDGAPLFDPRRGIFLWLGLGLSALEIACFLYYGKQP